LEVGQLMPNIPFLYGNKPGLEKTRLKKKKKTSPVVFLGFFFGGGFFAQTRGFLGFFQFHEYF
jgi:hypothetical protein